MSLSTIEAIRKSAAAYPGAVALQTPGKKDTTYAELLEIIDSTHFQLAQFGIQRGDRVGLVIPQRDAMCAAYLAVISGTTAAPLSPNTTPDELDLYIQEFRLSAVIIQDGLSDLVEKASAVGAAVIVLNPDAEIAGGFQLHGEIIKPQPELTYAEAGDVAVVFHTSGTTSRPKVVPRTHEFQLRKLGRDRAEAGLGPGDAIMNGMPLHHTQGLGAELLTTMLFGGTAVIVDFIPQDFVRHLEEYRPAKFTLVPSMHQMVVDSIPPGKTLPLDTGLRFVETSSSKLSADLRKRMEQVYGVPIVERYGATEVDTMVIVSLSREGVPEGSVGKRSHDGVVIMDEAGNALPHGQRGEICVHTDHTIAGYENNPEANEAAFRNGFYHTGDEGYLDENEFLFVVGRVSESINRGGEKIAPNEIDEVLARHPDVAHASAFGVADDRLGMEVWAAVVARAGKTPSPNEIRAFAARALSFPKVPKRIILVDTLPYNEIGKVKRAELARQLGPQQVSQ